MNFAINSNDSFISGWVAKPSIDLKAVLRKSDGTTLSKGFDREREDVFQKGLSELLVCGFRFESADLSNSKLGDMFEVTIKENEIELFKKSVILGNVKVCSNSFEKYEFLPRDDFSIQDVDTMQLFKDNCDLIAFKMLMIRLRRGKRAFSARGKFSGNAYKYMDSDWDFFKEFLERYFEVIKDVLTIRSMWSVVDTFTDFGTPIEKACALAISNYMYQERFAQSYQLIYSLEELKDEDKVLKSQKYYWGGMKTNSFALDDALDVFLTKNFEVLEQVPILKQCFILILKESLKADSSIISLNCNNSKYFQEVISWYERNCF